MNCEPACNRRLRQSPVVGIKVQCSDSAIVNGVTLSMCEQLQEDFQHCDRTWCFNEPTQKHLWQTRVEVRVEVGADQHQTDMCYLQHTIHLFTSILWVILVISSEMTGNTGQMSVCVSQNHCIHLSICVMSTFSKPRRLLRDGSETAGPKLMKLGKFWGHNLWEAFFWILAPAPCRSTPNLARSFKQVSK